MNEIVNRILSKRKEVPTERSLLVGISGIDASGKGFITAKLAEETIKAYETIYFPAQKIHFVKDEPQKNADLIFKNDRIY